MKYEHLRINCRHHRGPDAEPRDGCKIGLPADERCYRGCPSRVPIRPDEPGTLSTIPPLPRPLQIYPYPQAIAEIDLHPLPKPKGGVGTELKRGLKEADIFGAKGCGCDGKASLMDRMGVEWCEKNVPLIVGWLRSSAFKAGLGDAVTDEELAAVVAWAIDKARQSPAPQR